MKYEIGMKFIIPENNTIYEAVAYNEGVYTLEPECILDTEIDGSQLMIEEDKLPLPMYDDEYVGEMATVGPTDKPIQLILIVNPDDDRIGNPYFKACNAMKYKKGEARIARLHFLDSGMEYHKDSFKDWNPTNKEIKYIQQYLYKPNDDFKDYTNWQVIKYHWNHEYGFGIEMNIHDYLKGKYDERLCEHPSYVPSYTVMPDTWIYNPPKGKNKRH